MIRYDLRCGRGHAFEGWFGSAADYDEQVEAGLLCCPECGHARVEKAIMAPMVKRGDRAEIAATLREHIASEFDDVGTDFADEARAMHEGRKPGRGIYGKATAAQARELAEDGVPALPLPPALDPKRAAKKLN